MEDMKFTLKKAVFDTSAPGTLTLTNLNDMPVKSLKTNPIRTFNGSGAQLEFSIQTTVCIVQLIMLLLQVKTNGYL